MRKIRKGTTPNTKRQSRIFAMSPRQDELDSTQKSAVVAISPDGVAHFRHNTNIRRGTTHPPYFAVGNV